MTPARLKPSGQAPAPCSLQIPLAPYSDADTGCGPATPVPDCRAVPMESGRHTQVPYGGHMTGPVNTAGPYAARCHAAAVSSGRAGNQHGQADRPRSPRPAQPCRFESSTAPCARARQLCGDQPRHHRRPARGRGRGHRRYTHPTADLQPRGHAGILRFFDGPGLIAPGLVHVPRWRPDDLRHAEHVERIAACGEAGRKR